MNNSNGSTRHMILWLLKRHQHQTVSEIANEIEVTEMAVRRHLQSLEREGFVDVRLIRKAMGRPTHQFFLTEKGEESFPRNYGSLSLEFLEDMEKLSGKVMIDRLFEQRKERLKQKYQSTVKGTLAERIQALAQIQNENGYMVEWEQQDEETYQFVEYNCPIAKIAKKYPVACSCEKRLFDDLLEGSNATIKRESCIAEEDVSKCTYMIKQTEKKS